MQKITDIKSLIRIDGARIAILQSKWYREYTDKMVSRCVELLKKAGALEPEIHILPGSLELPLAAKTLAEKGGYEAFILLGAVVKGETFHFELVMEGCSGGASRISLDYGIPCIMEVLPCTNIDQLARRCAPDEFNKGIEAAAAAIEIISWIREVKASN